MSNNQSFCDDLHKKTIDENDKILYDQEGDRIEVKSWETQD